MSMVVALSCPVCGGPVSNSADQCRFCGSYVFIKSDLPKLSPTNLDKAMIQDQIKELRRRFRSDQHDEEAKYGLGVAYYSLGLLSDATRELAEASILTPENPHIHSQLAVVLRDRYREGDRSTLPTFRERIRTTLKLDPNHVEGLSLLYSLQMAEGDYNDAAQTYDKLFKVSPNQAREVRSDILKGRAKARLNSGDWVAARPEVSELAWLDETAAKGLLTQHIWQLNIHFPIVFTSPRFAQIITNRHLIFYGLGVISILFFFFTYDLTALSVRILGSVLAIGIAIAGPIGVEKAALGSPDFFDAGDIQNSSSLELAGLLDKYHGSQSRNLVVHHVDFL